MKKIITLVVAGIVLLMALSPAIALAGPPSPPDYGKYNPTDQPGQPPEEWGVEKVIPSPSAPGGAVRIITDPLVGLVGTDVPAATGWVTFWCQSKIGFKYNIGTIGLNRLSKYGVTAYGVQIQVVPPGTAGAIEIEPGLWVLLSTSTPVELDLGTFRTDANGSGGVKGVSRLSAGYVYDLTVEVSDGVTKVLEPGLMLLPSPPNPPNTWGPDTNGFTVY
ncbi:MAG: hypothetical protein MUP73_00670 [Dehalococcoidia bacterium]|nr:hypothetical protein [Dehalococcoidia bacterium]